MMTRDEILRLAAGRELDACIANMVMGIAPIDFRGPNLKCPKCGDGMRMGLDRAWCSPCREWKYSPYLEYSSDISAAWPIAELLKFTIIPTEIGYLVGQLSERAHLHGGEWFPSGFAEGKTAPLAICLAALLAKNEGQGVKMVFNEKVIKYWEKYYTGIDGLCTLCDQTGIINNLIVDSSSRGATMKINYCICPNGQKLRHDNEKLDNLPRRRAIGDVMTTRIKYLVLAYRKEQAAEWAKITMLKRSEWRYAGIPVLLLGLNDIEIIRLPGCERHPNYHEIDEIIKTARFYGVTERKLCKFEGCVFPVADRAPWLPPKDLEYCGVHHYAERGKRRDDYKNQI